MAAPEQSTGDGAGILLLEPAAEPCRSACLPPHAVQPLGLFPREPLLDQQLDLLLRERRPVPLSDEAVFAADEPHLAAQRCPQAKREMGMVPARRGDLVEQQ